MGISDVNHETDVELHGWVSTQCTGQIKEHCCERALYFKLILFCFCFTLPLSTERALKQAKESAVPALTVGTRGICLGMPFCAFFLIFIPTNLALKENCKGGLYNQRNSFTYRSYYFNLFVFRFWALVAWLIIRTGRENGKGFVHYVPLTLLRCDLRFATLIVATRLNSPSVHYYR